MTDGYLCVKVFGKPFGDLMGNIILAPFWPYQEVTDGQQEEEDPQDPEAYFFETLQEAEFDC